MNELFDRDILSGEQFTLDEIQTVMGVAHDMRRRVAHGTHLDNCHGKVLASLFFVYIQIFILGAICLYCLTSAVTSTLIFTGSIVLFKITKAS